ncbi:unnamed protein product [Gongylonema pulchrum]|uniref:Doublecortin domain-containing protein n=1 Tax=Gongylonema pulchrum TaxID=637853 RepID=A0A183D261_9BILA|nr:unnamed protein product [Gongylonema pulchrum]
MSVQFTIAGTGPVQCKKERKIVNFNLSHIVKGHLDYSRKLTEVLAAVGVRVTPHRDESMPNFDETVETSKPSADGSDKTNEQGLPLDTSAGVLEAQSNHIDIPESEVSDLRTHASNDVKESEGKTDDPILCVEIEEKLEISEEKGSERKPGDSARCVEMEKNQEIFEETDEKQAATMKEKPSEVPDVGKKLSVAENEVKARVENE